MEQNDLLGRLVVATKHACSQQYTEYCSRRIRTRSKALFPLVITKTSFLFPFSTYETSDERLRLPTVTCLPRASHELEGRGTTDRSMPHAEGWYRVKLCARALRAQRREACRNFRAVSRPGLWARHPFWCPSGSGAFHSTSRKLLSFTTSGVPLKL